jgi:succinate dehydrogenase / fumarate reductase membrane anchor subunit
MPETPRVYIMRSALSRAQGLGSSRTGSHHWVVERVAAAALVPLTVWFIFSMIHLLGSSHQRVIEWMSSPLTMVLMLILIGLTFNHLQLGVRSILSDYVHSEWLRVAAIFFVKAACLLLASLCIISVLKTGL